MLVGWCGDPESDIPLSVFAKHVLGLHAAGDMAFHKDFEAIHQVRGHMSNGHLSNGHDSAHNNGNASSTSNGVKGPSGKAATTFPDILGGGRGERRGSFTLCN